MSPFDCKQQRHTSFRSLDLVAEVEDDDGEIEIDDNKICRDTYRSSGKEGQHVNKTASAIRMPYSATHIAVKCQNK
jgi:peptide chain release factor 2